MAWWSRRRRTAATRRIGAWSCAAVALVATLAASAAVAAAASDAGTPPPDGRALWEQRCAPCHGVDGRGDGPEASSFAKLPPDVRQSLAGVDEERAVARLRDGLPLTLASDPRALKQRLSNVEPLIWHLQKLPEIHWPTVDRGAAVYAASCAACHGPFGQPLAATALPPGVQKPPRDLRDPAWQHATSDTQLREAMQHGQSAMPAIPAARDPRQAKDVVTFIRVLSPGFETYSYYCAACHGDDGRGKGVLASGKNAPPVAFDRAWRASQDPEDLRLKVTHMLSLHGPAMPHFRSGLDDSQLRAIVRYLEGGS